MTKPSNIVTISTALACMWLLGACGGQTITNAQDGGTGGSSSAGSGGSNVGGGGSGGSNVGGGGSGGSNVGGGGSGGSETCPPVADCNWCGGTTVSDKNGCVIGYQCANGVDPCSTDPCHDPSDCATDEMCGDDMLCWPTPVPMCGSMGCSGGTPGGSQSCSCDWQCSGKNYKFKCKVDGNGVTTCDCSENGVLVDSCAETHDDIMADAGIVDPCDDCCGFPKPTDSMY